MPITANYPAPVKVEKGADVWASDKKEWVYVTIPKLDVLDGPHPDIFHNNQKFEAGKTHLVPKLVAEDIEDRLNVFRKSVIRTLQPHRDAAVNRVSIGGAQVD